MLIKYLKSEPEIFYPIEFKQGINLITGERSGENNKSHNKTNGVGKTLLVQFIDFCLLSDYKRNRISRIPKNVVPMNCNIILELSSLGHNVMIKRSRANEKCPQIYVDGIQRDFTSLENARKYLSKYIFGDQSSYSFREMMSVFKRTEKDGYSKIDSPDGATYSSIIPYLHLFDLNIDLYKRIETKAGDLINAHKYSSELKKDIESQDIDIKKIEAYRNDLKAQVEKLDIAVEELSHYETYDTISDDISKLDTEIERANLLMIKIKEEIKQIEAIPKYQEVSKNDILAIYNDCKKGLGDIIIKEINEVEEFQRIIDSFKNEIIGERKNKLLSQKDELDGTIRNLSNTYKDKISVLDKTGNLQSLKVSLSEHQFKSRQYDKISFLSEQYHAQETNKILKKKERDDELLKFQTNKEDKNNIIKSFEKVVLEIHHHLYDNKKASFEINVKKPEKYSQRTFVSFDMETDDSGSARTEHEKVLIFDLSLLFCEETRKRHIGTIIHDGGFEGVNEETKFQILNWLYEQQNKDKDFQYIVTINRDSFESLEKNKKFDFDLNTFVRANYTKTSRFLKQQYTQEKK